MGTIREKSAKERKGDVSAELIRSGMVAFRVGDMVELPRRGNAKVLRFTPRNAVIQFPDGERNYKYVQLLKKVGQPRAIK